MRNFEGKSKENRSKSVVWPRFRAPKGVAGPLFQFLQIFGIFLVSEIEAMDQEGLAVSDIGVSEAPEKPSVAWFFTVFFTVFHGFGRVFNEFSIVFERFWHLPGHAEGLRASGGTLLDDPRRDVEKADSKASLH